jgi:hypothetical protein
VKAAIDRRGWAPTLWVVGLVVAGTGCAPTLDVLGVYFPAWLVSTIVGVVVAYAVVRVFSGREALRSLGQSALFFCSLAVSIAMLTWWVFFSAF